MPSLVLRFERDEISREFPYGCMVEMWDKVVGRGSSGSKRRKYHAAFTEEERNIISKWHVRFERWYVVSGPPECLYFRSNKTVHLLKRAIEFFATV